ncbi:glycosyltransferase family 2 protein [Alkalimarinus alittae]|uniref:Glycosyltransferase family 2 protein n=1 Tax=Alkalimarinus alittae TaxID=2961619 RepID=A0ABY6MZA4_9ALTE|nr:glycosyltransferase family 2 protein [Alkalimarinus alittae]UZE95130.1 glycosyltransferase family 2 protein [Alkalimarinus alittae]
MALTGSKRCISLVVPCFNEGGSLDAFFFRLETTLNALTEYDYEILCIDDGSQDDTLTKLLCHAERNPCISVIELSRNFGKEAALTAGIDAAKGHAVIPMDADLQHPPELIDEMLSHWEAGSDVVLARRLSRDTDHSLQRLVTGWFYLLHNRISDCEIPRDVGDFRLMDRCVVDALKALPERRRFMKGLFAWVGFRQTVVEFEVESRHSGVSSFNTKKLWGLAIEGITSFSAVPLSVWVYAGVVISLVALVSGSWIIVKTLAFGVDVPGYASILVAVLFLGGVQLMGIGVLGAYIGRIYSESKQRPIYIVRNHHTCVKSGPAHEIPAHEIPAHAASDHSPARNKNTR